MKWARINGAYFNTDHIQTFYWQAGKLCIWLVGEEGAERYNDPRRENYIRLCQAIGVRPIGEDESYG